MENIRLATPEEIESIRESSDLGPGCTVWAMEPSLAVTRQALELDPVYYNGVSHSKMALFIWGMENILRAAGHPAYYFNVGSEDEKYQKIIEGFGAQRVSKGPEFRYKKSL